MDEWFEIEFIGGPIDGPHPVHPTMNHILYVETNPEGYYSYYQGKYYWELKKS